MTWMSQLLPTIVIDRRAVRRGPQALSSRPGRPSAVMPKAQTGVLQRQLRTCWKY